MRKHEFLLLALSCVLGLVLVFSSYHPVYADSYLFQWSGLPIDPQGDPQVVPTFLPSGSALFDISGTIVKTLTITLTNTTATLIDKNWMVLTGLTWDITGVTYTKGVTTLDKVSAVIALGSSLVGGSCPTPPTPCDSGDLSSEWGFKENLKVDGIETFGFSAVGDYRTGTAPGTTFGAHTRFDTTTNLWGPKSGGLGQGDAGIVGTLGLTDNGFKGPVVQNQMVFTFNIIGSFSLDKITNVEPFFGTGGAYLVPEPSSVLLLGSGLVGLGLWSWRWKRREDGHA